MKNIKRSKHFCLPGHFIALSATIRKEIFDRLVKVSCTSHGHIDIVLHINMDSNAEMRVNGSIRIKKYFHILPVNVSYAHYPTVMRSSARLRPPY